MKKKALFKSFFVLVGSGLVGFASCTNEDENSVTPDEKGLIPVEIRSGINGGRTALDGDGKAVVFQANDSLAVWDADKHEFTTTGSGNIAVFKGTLNASTPTGQTLSILYPYSAGKDCDGTNITATIPATQTATENTFDPSANLSVATADYTKGQNVTCTLQNVCGLLKFTIAEVDGYDEYDYVEISDAAETKQNIAGTVTINPADATVTGGDKTVITLKAGEGQTLKADSSTIYYVVLRPGTFTNGIEMKFYKDGADKYGTAALTKTGGGTLSIGPGVILNAGVVTPVMKKDPPKPLSGKFTVYVSDDKKDTTKVCFAPGNLYCTRTDNAGSWSYDFAFEANQWDYRTCNFTTEDGTTVKGSSCIGGTTSDTPVNTSGLFQWLKSGIDETQSGVTEAKKNYGAFSVLDDGTTTGTTSDTLFADWGASIDGNKWRTLSNAEWGYLLSTRTVKGKGSQQFSYGEGIVNGVQGLIILPDDWDENVCTDFRYGMTEWGNVFSETEWSQMESAGCVFLPCAGYRRNSSVFHAGEGGNLWSSSAFKSKSARAYNIDFSKSSLTPQNDTPRYYGFTVRLVCSAE